MDSLLGPQVFILIRRKYIRKVLSLYKVAIIWVGHNNKGHINEVQLYVNYVEIELRGLQKEIEAGGTKAAVWINQKFQLSEFKLMGAHCSVNIKQVYQVLFRKYCLAVRTWPQQSRTLQVSRVHKACQYRISLFPLKYSVHRISCVTGLWWVTIPQVEKATSKFSRKYELLQVIGAMY